MLQNAFLFALGTAFFLLFTQGAAAQVEVHDTRWKVDQVVLSVVRSRFQVHGVLAEEYPTWEVHARAGITKQLGSSRFQFKSGLGFCLKIKRKPYLVNNIYYSGKGQLLFRLDETTSKLNHGAIEIPLEVSYTLRNGRASVRAGFLLRHWMSTTDMSSDMLGTQDEIGFIIGAERRIAKQLVLGATAYTGLNKLPGGYLIGTGEYWLRNQFAGITMAYTLPSPWIIRLRKVRNKE